MSAEPSRSLVVSFSAVWKRMREPSADACRTLAS
jgi:hypothetical protein